MDAVGSNSDGAFPLDNYVYLAPDINVKETRIYFLLLAAGIVFLIWRPTLEQGKIDDAELRFRTQKAMADSMEIEMWARDVVSKKEIAQLKKERDSLQAASAASADVARAINTQIKKSLRENDQRTNNIIKLPAPEFQREFAKFPADSIR